MSVFGFFLHPFGAFYPPLNAVTPIFGAPVIIYIIFRKR